MSECVDKNMIDKDVYSQTAELEMRLVPMERDRFHLSAEEAVERCDENTSGAGLRPRGGHPPLGADRSARPFELITRGDELPVFAFTLKHHIDNFTVFDFSTAVRERGWQVPAYTFPDSRTDLAALRVVVRRGFTHDTADLLVKDLKRQLPRLEKQAALIQDGTTASSFHH
jgi:glutamate/tyrosine decarboxylase-like PLP-dependent enzyme